MSKRKKYIESCEISQVVTLQLGGFEQKILIEGKSKNLPIIITLHGGPGMPVPFSVGCSGLFPKLTDNAIMVYWDQLGCGINNYKIDDSFHIDNFIRMTCDLVDYIKTRFIENKIYIFGISWGSVLALKTALLVPEKLDGIFVYGQVLKDIYFNEEVIKAFNNAPQKTKQTVKKIIETGKDCEQKVLNNNLKILYKLLNKHTNAYFNKQSKRISIGKIVFGLLTSKDYSFKDFRAIMKNGYAGNNSLWQELLHLDLTQLLAEVKITYAIMQGETDIVTSTLNVIKTVEMSNNKNVTVELVKNSGHIPSQEAMDKCIEKLLQFTK